MAANKITQDWLDTALDKDMNTKCALLWTHGKPFCDTVMKVVKKQSGEVYGTFNVHKLTLAMGSRYFATKLYSGDPDEIPNEIPFNFEVYDEPLTIVELALEFMYTDGIGRSVDWIEVGGLIYFAKMYSIPRLTKYCTDKFEREIGERCESVLEQFHTLISLSNEQYKGPKENYREIVKLCLSYILRNGDVILRASNFRNKLSIENLEVFIGSDYFCVPSETLVFKGLQKWARAQCRKKGLDKYNIEEIKNILRKPNENKESIGLLKYVRFPVFTEAEFSRVNQSSDLIIPKSIEELVHRYHVLKVPTGIFSEKRRPVEVDAEAEDFLEHIDQLICKLPAFTTSPTVSSADNSYLPSLQDDDQLPRSSQSTNANQINIASIKQEVDTETRSHIPSIPDHISIGTPSQNSPWTSCASTPVRKPMTQKRMMLKRAGNEAELTETKKGSLTPIKMMKIKKEDEKTPDNIRDLKLPAESRTSKDDHADAAILINQLIHKKKVRYSGIVEECRKKSHIAEFVGNHFEIVDLKMKSKCQPVCMPKLRSFSVEATLDKKMEGNLVKHLASINLEDFIFFYHDDSNPKNRLAQIWGNKINTTIKISEVTVFYAHAGQEHVHDDFSELTLNYTKKSSFFSLKDQGILNGINVLNLGNCTVNQNSWLQNEISANLVELRLFRVKDLDLRAVLGQCKSLKILCVWAVENQVPTIYLNDIASKNLRSLFVAGYMINFDPDMNNSVFPKCRELCLINYSCDPVFTEMIPKTFPNLRKLCVYSETCPPGADFLLKITSQSSLEEIFVRNLERASLIAEKVSKLNSLIKNFHLILGNASSVKNCENYSFQLERSKPGLWEGKNVRMKYLERNIYKSFGLDCFYSFEAYKKLISISSFD